MLKQHPHSITGIEDHEASSVAVAAPMMERKDYEPSGSSVSSESTQQRIPLTSPPEQTTSKANDSNVGKNLVATKDHPSYSKFFKMLKMVGEL